MLLHILVLGDLLVGFWFFCCLFWVLWGFFGGTGVLNSGLDACK
jgi:hypothetical protein